MTTHTTTDEQLLAWVAAGRPDAESGPAGEKMHDVLTARLGLRRASLAGFQPTAEVIGLVPAPVAVRHQILPLERQGRTLRVAVADPLAIEPIDELAHLLQLHIEPALAAGDEIAQAVARCYGGERESVGTLNDEALAAGLTPSADSPAADLTEKDAGDAPVIQLVHDIINEAIRRRASDIHLEPLERRFRVRYRIDGALLEAEAPSKRLQAAVISRLKIMANISIAEKRLPQDGRIQIAMGSRALDLRVSSLPTAHGESIVMRILDKETLRLGLPELGFMSDDQARFERLITAPDGIVLVTGPTGSGKTTTLYSCLQHINKPDCKIITVEDPVEYQLSGVNQVPVRQEIGMTFASALRAMLRQSPNVVMVGEIRDGETAEIAINASLTGHLVFSTLHTNDAPGAVTRLADIGVKPFLVATSLRGVLAQRLVRKVCPHCSQPHRPEARELRLLGISATAAAEAQFRRGTGCPACQGTGYRGRLGIFELLAMTERLRELVYAGTGAARLREAARAEGMRTMREDGIRKIIAGLTTVEEVASVTVGDAGQSLSSS